MNILTKYTFETLKKNKGRTLVTVVGIVLSLSMLTSVMVLISSSQQYLKNSVISTYGMWHGVILDADENVKNAMISNEDIADYHYLENIGYAVNSSAGSAAKPYFFVAGADKGFFEKMPVRLTKGRLPENENEIILPEHSSPYLSALEFDGKQTITLETGQRKYGNLRLTQLDGYEPGETLEISETREFTVVGIYQKPSFESWDAAGATALTAATGENRYLMDIYYNPVNITQTYNIMDVYTGAPYFCGSLTNTTLLRFSGASAEKGYNRVLYGLGGILCAIIIFASIALIYNAFSISISERTKQFGLLSSIGATKRQLLYSVLTEAVMLCTPGIPMGILTGIIGISITLKLTQSIFSIGFEKLVFAGAENVYFRTVISPPALLLAAGLGFVTVLVSAYVPAKKALKHSAIDSIRQSYDIIPDRKTAKPSPVVQKLFGFEGTVAVRNFRRNRHRYRSTIVSLFMSIVLFISAYNLCDMLRRSVDSVVSNVDYDIHYVYYPDTGGFPFEEQYQALRQLDNVTQSAYFQNVWLATAVDAGNVWAKQLVEEYLGDDKVQMYIQYIFVDDETYEKWVEENGLGQYLSPKNDIPVAFTTNIYQVYNEDDERYEDLPVFRADGIKLENRYTSQEFTIRFCDSMPYGTSGFSSTIPIILPFSLFEKFTGYAHHSVNMVFSSDNPSVLATDIINSAAAMGVTSVPYIYNAYQEYRTNRAIIGIIKVFTFGFIALISCIATANVLNTISTNINLRRREFAILRSVGMTDKGMHRMMMYECMMYGIKSVAAGVPAGILISFGIYKVISFGYSGQYIFPAQGIIISVLSVFAVVFITMLYSSGKVLKENTLQALKNENI